MKEITLIVPLRLSPALHEGETRLAYLLETIPGDVFDVLVVDYGSRPEHRATIERLCSGHSHTAVVRVDVEDERFSIGAARDVGVEHAKTPIVIFHDVDFLTTTDGYRRILDEARARRIAECIYDFFCVPVVFLTAEGAEACRATTDPASVRFLIHNAVTTLDRALVEFTAYGASAIVANRHHYLAIGGHGRQFSGHGAEDFDILHRLAAYAPRAPRPPRYYEDVSGPEPNEYRGFRAYFALYGIDVFQRGIFLVHLWHPRRAIPDYHQLDRNLAILRDLMKDFDRTHRQPFPLQDAHATKRTLLLMDPDSRTFRALRHATPLMGQLTVTPESEFADGEAFTRFVQANGIDTVGFLNPYGNAHREALYGAVRNAGMSYWTFDRGALPNSWFFDPHGFNYDSTTYARDVWDRPLTQAEQGRVQQYLQELVASEASLEHQGPRRPLRRLRRKLGIGDRKVLLVPLQRPTDSVVCSFAGPCGDFHGFCRWVRQVTEMLDPNEWVVLAKAHPLEDEHPNLGEHVQYAPDTSHIHDLLDLADRVMVLNSGTGVLASAFDTPVIVCGHAFYQHDGLAWQASSAGEALDLVRDASLAVDRQATLRWFHHLLERVYSFGPTIYAHSVGPTGNRIRLAEHIPFSELRLPHAPSVHLGEPNPPVPLDSLLFAPFQGTQHRGAPMRDYGTPPKWKQRLVSTAVAPFLSPRLRKKLSRNPVAFFTDSKSPLIRTLGKRLLS